MVPKTAALLIIDVQNGFVKNENTKSIVPSINHLIKTFGQGRVLASKFVNPRGGLWEKLMNWHALKEPPETDFYPELSVPAGSAYAKQAYSAWNEVVQGFCKEHGITELFLCGIDTDQCVLATAIDVFSAGIRPVVITDCCASSAGTAFHDAALMLLERLIGKEQLVTSANLL